MDTRKLVDGISGDLQKAREMNPDQKRSKRRSRVRTGRLRGESNQETAQQQALPATEKCKRWGLGDQAGCTP